MRDKEFSELIRKSFEEAYDYGKNFDHIKKSIQFAKYMNYHMPKKPHYFARGFVSGFACLVLILVVGILAFNGIAKNDKNVNNQELITYNKIVSTLNEEVSLDVINNFVDNGSNYKVVDSNNNHYIYKYYIVVYINKTNGSSWSEYLNEDISNNEQLLEYFNLNSLINYTSFNEVNGEISISFDAASKMIITKYMEEIFGLVEFYGVEKVEFMIKLEPYVGVSYE